MNQKILKCGLIGGFILFVWGAVAWTVLPFQKAYMFRFDNEKEVKNAIADNAKCDGIYMVPAPAPAGSSQEDQASANQRISSGPFSMVAVSVNGQNPSNVGRAIATLIVKIIEVCLVAWLIFFVGGLDFNRLIRFVTMVGIVIALSVGIPLWIWFSFPAGFIIGMMSEIVVGWFIVSLALARILHPKDRKAKA
jgi:hypothetical protein